jgi:ATP-dependent helicase/nuclease subunit A
MSGRPKINSAVTRAQEAQAEAIEPAVSAWVSASAGSGKTTVLTSRVLALMLAGVMPTRILCVTFTKAAAAEMSNRIMKRLGKWVTAHEDELIEDLAGLMGREPVSMEVTRARRLFARVLDAPGGLRIETIHAFCQSLLRRFPIEAGVSPQFALMDERTAAEALDAARDAVIAAAEDKAHPALRAALALLTARLHETRFPDILHAINAQRGKIERLFERHGGLNAAGMANCVAATRTILGLEAVETAERALDQACSDSVFDGAGLKQAAAALSKGTKADQERAKAILIWLDNKATRRAGLDQYCSAFLTQEGQPRKTLATKAVAAPNPEAAQALGREAARLAALKERMARLETADSTQAILTVALEILSSYRTYKQRRSLLDFDDLIQLTRRLLRAPGAAAWVLYKLDGGIDHILIDEAQDTNPEQWDIIGALSEEFFAGEGRFESANDAAAPGRTIFAVGDRKQSIYSFQGADPAGFSIWRETFKTKVRNAGRDWRSVGMDVSFRSSESVLSAVDLVFQDAAARDGVAEAGEPIVHHVAREGRAGRVEVWPAVKPLPADDAPSWKPPVERSRGDSPQNRLAGLIALRIKAMIGRETLPARDRKIRAGDIMVLVRRRTGFVDELVRQLKARDVAVAGVDRMVLPQQLAVMDLIALGRFLLLPEDDLSLATVLKSPLIGLSEEALFDLAHDRSDRSLWAALSIHAGGSNAYAAAHQVLADLLARADYMTPFALFSFVTVGHDGRRKALSRLGLDADDPIDEFLALALDYEKSHPPSLQAFLHWVDQGEIEIKRDLEQGGADAVRIMTAHGSKGLQAPIVFLPDTLQVPRQIDALLWTDGDAPVLLWRPSSDGADAVWKNLRDAAKARQMQEYRRLLYVAMTRAEDRLYVCGWEANNAAPAGNWYELISAGLRKKAGPILNPFLQKEAVTDDAEMLMLENQQTTAPDAESEAESPPSPATLPAWAAAPPPPERDPPQPLAPSRASRSEPAIISPLAEDGTHRFQRGLIIHRLLQSIPDVPAARWAAAATAFVARPAWNLSKEQQQAIVAETLAVLNNSDFAALFAPNSLAEVPVVGLAGKHAVSGQVDRLVVTQTEVFIIDYKTNRPPPREVAKVDEGYVFQMAVYRDVLRRIYPKHVVRCVLLWTDGPFTMEVPAAMMETALRAVTA